MSRTEFEALQAAQHHKIRAKLEKVDANAPVEREADLHQMIVDECKRRGWIAFHGSMAHSTFRTPGEPDFIILPDVGRMSHFKSNVWLIECKTRKGKLSPAQLAIHAWAAKLGHTVHVVRSFAEFLEVVK